MIGRGTRRCDEIGKTHFTIFDCVGIMEAFKEKIPDFGELYQNRKAKDISEVIKQIKMKFMPKENVQTLKRKLNYISREMDPEFRTKLAEFIPDGDLKTFASDLDKKFDKDYKGTLALFENEKFISLLLDYPRRPRYFIIDEISQDEVIASEYLFHTLDDRDLKPEEYIKVFEKFVKQNKSKIDALKILLEKPRNFDATELKELLKTLASQPEIFTEPRLRRAYKDQLADVIAFVKHAALNVPLLHPEERIKKAFEMLYHKHEFTEAQKEWLELIKLHLMHELSIEKEDFNDIPFSRRGGLKAAMSVFGDKLDKVVEEINELVIKV
jgi:type I restriction enzyme R subunit